MITKPPITADAVSDQWIADCREALQRQPGIKIRAGVRELTIDTFSVSREEWMPLMLPGSGTTFASAWDRDAVLRKLEAK